MAGLQEISPDLYEAAMIDTLQVQFLPFIASAISIFLFYTFFAGMPEEFEEAAAIDGAGPWRTLFTVILPNAKPVFASVAILIFQRWFVQRLASSAVKG